MSSTQKLIKVGAIAFAIFLIVNIIEGILFVFHLCGGNIYRSGEMNFQEEYTIIENIDMDISASKIIFDTGEKFKIDASNVSKSFEVKETNGNLKIQEKRNYFWSHESGTIRITIPNEMVINRLNISSGAGKIELKNITVNHAKIEVGAGSFVAENSIFYETKIDSGAGEVRIDKSILHNLDLATGVGKAKLQAEILGKSQIDCGVGEVHLLLPKKNDYQLKLEKGIGSIEVDGKKLANESTYGDGENYIAIEGGIGSIKVDFNE